MPRENKSIRKTAIIEAARELFFRFGFSKTSMEDIAVQSGLAKPSLYYYFNNKEAIFEEIVLNEVEKLMKRIENSIKDFNTAEEKFVQFYQTFYQNLKIYAREMDDLPEWMCDHSPHGNPALLKIRKMFVDKLRPILETIYREENYLPQNSEEMLQTVTFMTEFINLDWMRNEEEDHRDKVIKTMLNIILRGIKGGVKVEGSV